jgi:DNA-binding CsgD family transcriptional regulator
MTKQATLEQREEAARLYESGKSARDIAKILPMSHQTVLNCCREKGVAIRPPHSNNTN